MYRSIFISYSSGIVLLDQRSAGDPSFLLCRGSCILPSTYVESTFQGRQELQVPQCFFISKCIFISLFIFYIYVVEATTTPGGQKWSVSFAAFIPACSLPHTPCILHGCLSISPSLMAEGEPCSRLDRTGALPELEQAFKI